MKIKYAKSRIKNNFGYGILMIGVGLFAIFYNPGSAFSYLWLLFGALQVGTAWYIQRNPYLSIENNKITRHYIFPKTLEIDEIRKIRKFVNSFKIETSDKTITIDKYVMEPESLYRLADYLNNLKIDEFGVEGSSVK